LTEEPRVIDGADRRKKRILDLLSFIHNNGGATAQEMKSFLMIRFGLRHSTGAEYIQELHLAGLITQEGLKWFTTTRYRKLAEHLYS